uniref:WSN domain-containing protein n=1 Tax=Caenorhabditis japonica TaxID=281687 RepID=A0A8R1HL64_CAEJA
MFILHSGNSNFTKETAPVKRDDNLTSAKALEKNAATLNRVLNAILFHNELQNGSVTMKDFVAESMGFQDASRFDSIKTIHVQKTVKYMGLTDFISNQTSGKLDELVIGMRKLEMQNLSTLTSAKVAEILSLFSNYAIDVKFRYWIDLDSIKDLLKPFQKGFPSSLDEKNAVNTFDKVEREVVNVDALLIEMKNLYNDVVAFEEKLNSTYILNIEKFLQETNTTDIPNLNNAFSSLNASFDYFVSWWNALVGFPNGLNDLEKLSGEFADHWLMAVLNGGKTLDLLKKELMPLLNITKDLKSKEVASIDLGRHVYFSAVRKVFNNVEIMNSKDPLSVLNAFSKAKNDLLKLQQTFGFDNSIVQEVKEVIRSNADFTNFKDGLRRSQEVVDVEESLDQLELLQFAVMRKNGSLSSLIDNAENFFTDFFKEPSDPDHNWLLIAAFSTFIIVFIVSVGLYCFVWKRVKKNKEKSSTKKCLKNEHSKDNNSKEEHSKDNNSKEKLLKEEHSKDNNSKEKLLKEEHSKDNNSKEKHSKKKEAQKKEPKEREIQAVQNSDGHAGQSVNDANRNACASQNQEEQNSDGSAAQNESNMSMKEKVPVETFSLPNLDVMGPIKAERADKMLAS